MSHYPAVAGPDPAAEPALASLLESLRERHNDAICAVLIYGSCLRSGDLYDGLLDLYLLCDSYERAYSSKRLALANRLLPPNVFYAESTSPAGKPGEIAGAEKTLRSKVTVISLADFQRGCTRNWFQSYIWGRFSQPTHIVWSRDPATRTTVEDSLLDAAHTLLLRSVPALPPSGHLADLWEAGLSLSYGTELRTERPGRTGELVRGSQKFYETVAHHHADSLAFPFAVYDGDYESQVTPGLRRQAQLAWKLRRVQGKTLSLARLVKALFTFEGGLDYIAWKLQRHSGEDIQIPDKVRRRPLVYMWGFFWGLYRRGIFK